MKKERFALISIYNKEKIEFICDTFKKNNIQIISTGSTANYIEKIGFKCSKVSDFTKFEEILDGRVKTLHPLIHASLLFDRNNKKHINKFKNLHFPIIDFVIVNLYPFEERVKKNKDNKHNIEMIDIGGPALLRSAAKNYRSVTAICNVNQYEELITNMNNNSGQTSLNFRKKMASKVFNQISYYDNVISYWIKNEDNFLVIPHHEKKALRYGENPHQKSYFYNNSSNHNLFNAIVQEGKQLSYNNILDIDSAYDCIYEFSEPTCVIIKHNNPCGAASHKKIKHAFLNAYNADPISAFGGVVIFNKSIDEKLANLIISNFFEVIIAPNFNKKILGIFNKKKRLILIESNKIKRDKKTEIKSINGGYLMQENNSIFFSKKAMRCVSKKIALKKQVKDLIFGFKICKHVKSNAVVLVKNEQTIGIGAGQMSRIDATKIALSKNLLKKKKQGFIAASDAFFPFVDNIKLLIQHNCQAIIQPKGSINDKVVIKFANKYNLPLYFSKFRFFKH